MRPPLAPADSNVEQESVGCPGYSKIASGIPTANPSPQTLHAPCTVGTGATGGIEDGTCACGEAGAVEAGPSVAVVQEHTSFTIRSGRKSQFSTEICPAFPPSFSVPHK
jgi:hypothetical protein